MPTPQPLVSVIIPCYNSTRYLDEAVDSALAQTYPDLEVVIVDDGSSDPEAARQLREYRRPRTRVLTIPHGGPSAARNHGIAHAQGRYILPLDDDDKIAPTYIEKAVARLEADPALGIVYCRATSFGEREGEWDLPQFNSKRILVDNLIFTSALFRKSAWERCGGYNLNMTEGMEDYDFWLSLLEQDDCRVERLDEVLFFYRIRQGSRTMRMVANGTEPAMFTQLFYNHQALFLRDRNMYHLFRRQRELTWENARLQQVIATSPVLKLEKRLSRRPRLYAAYLAAARFLIALTKPFRRERSPE